MFRTTLVIVFSLFCSSVFAQYFQPGSTNVQVNDFGAMPQINVQQGVEFQPRVNAPYYQPQTQSQWRAPRQPDVYHYHQHEILQRQQYVQPQYYVPQTYYTYPYQQQYYYYPQCRSNWWGW